jgi:RNA 2',3'-cyclic 3'-phosphodiesterase
MLHPRSTSDGLLFLATLPDAATAMQIYRTAEVIKRARGFEGQLIQPDRLHVTLFSLNGLPEYFITKACEAVADARVQRFDVCFDRTVSFRGKPGNHPFVLAGDKGAKHLGLFRQKLAVAMMSKGLRRWTNSDFTPHVTLVYDARNVEECPVEPVGWNVSELVLIHSKRGHVHLARWPLRSDPTNQLLPLSNS